MKRTAVLTALIALIGLTLSGSGCMMTARKQKAQTAFDRLAARSPDQIAGFLNDRMTAKLALTSAQLPLVYAINLDYAMKIQSAAASTEGAVSKTQTMEKASDAQTDDLKKVLTPDQFSRFLALKEALRAAVNDGVKSGR